MHEAETFHHDMTSIEIQKLRAELAETQKQRDGWSIACARMHKLCVTVLGAVRDSGGVSSLGSHHGCGNNRPCTDCDLNDAIDAYRSMSAEWPPPDLGSVSDGYHTFNELYEHRIALFLALCRTMDALAQDTIPWSWRSRRHSDGSELDGWFIMGIHSRPGAQITYHLPDRKWEEASFAVTLERAPEWDKHTSADVLERLGRLYRHG